VVVVVDGNVVVVDDDVPVPRFDEVDGDVVVVGATVVVVLGVCSGALLDAVAPGCSLATTTPMTTVAPVAARAASRVRIRRDATARRLVSGEWTCRVDLIDHFLASAPTDRNSRGYGQPCVLLWTDCDIGSDSDSALAPNARFPWGCASDRGHHAAAQRMFWPEADSFIAPPRVRIEPEGTMTATRRERGVVALASVPCHTSVHRIDEGSGGRGRCSVAVGP
jgi:hypothetical protein